MKIIVRNAILVQPTAAGANSGHKNKAAQDETVREPQAQDIYIVDGRFSEPVEGPYDSEYDASGLHVFPGLVDAHCHLREPGFEYKEDIESGSKSAARGGFTSVMCMPNTKPVADNAAVISFIKSRAAEKAVVNIFPIAAVSKGLEGKELAEFGLMKEAGAVAVSDDGAPISTSNLLRLALEYASDFDLPVINHCEDREISAGGIMNEGYNSTLMGIKGSPSAAEDIMVARDIAVAEYLSLPVHIAHVSTRGAVRMIREAKARGAKVTAETCPQYFVLTDDACLGYNTLARAYPPMRRPEDLKAIVEGLKDGTLDLIGTDHAPHHEDEKDIEFSLASNGMTGFETAFQLAYTYLVETGQLGLGDLARLLSSRPSEIFKLDRGSFDVGKAADLTFVDLSREVTVDRFKMVSKSQNSPFHGYGLKSDVVLTLVGGKEAYREV